MASSTALTRKRTDTDLMPPPPPAKRIKRPKEVLDEDTYTSALSHIIARDFFPGLLEGEAQQEYLDALESRDDAWISNAGRRLHRVMTPGPRHHRAHHYAMESRASGQTPVNHAGETPASVVSSSVPSVDGRATTLDLDIVNMSLIAFQGKYTSEDNESFYKLLDKQNQKKVEKYAWLWTGNQLPSKQQLKQREVEDKLLKTRGTLQDDGFKKDRLAIKDKDVRPAAPDQWKVRPNNEVFFPPDGVDDLPLETPAQRAQAESRAGPKTIVYENTRPMQPSLVRLDGDGATPARPGSPTLSEIRDALAGKRRPCDVETVMSGGDTPRVDGYAFVDDEEPAPSPASTAPNFRFDLGPGNATPNPFKIGKRGKREELHHRMVDRISQAKRTSSRLGNAVGAGSRDKSVPRLASTPSTMASNLTPAARRLWGKIDTPGRRVSASPFGQMRNVVTPKQEPRFRAGGTPRMGSAGLRQATQ